MRNKQWIDLLFTTINKNWNQLRLFAFQNRTFFEFIFLLCYTLEQGVLIFVAEIFGMTSAIIGLFSLIVLFTFAVHKMVMESRMRLLEEGVRGLRNENKILKQKFEVITEKYI